ncbi:sensor histidine kinase [Cognatiyoonia koreensis]|nr:histidine kinase dimerization/phosphoacceptor domain -containing protein [Cognatiyoonia koreensis]
MLGLALLPIGLIAVYQTLSVARAAERSTEMALLAVADRAAQEDRLAIERAFGAGDMLGNVVGELLDDPAICSDYLRNFVEREELFSFVGVMPLDGTMECSSDGTVSDFSEYPNFADATARDRPFIEVDAGAPASGTSVIIVSYPYYIADSFAGYVTISVPHERLDTSSLDEKLRSDGLQELITFNDMGIIVTAQGNREDALAYLPSDWNLTDVDTTRSRTFRATGADGNKYIYSLVPVENGQLTILGVWNASVDFRNGAWYNRLPPALFPALMWIASLLVAAMAIYSLVLRHISRLRADMDLFATKRKVASTRVTAEMPNELQVLNARFLEMTDAIVREEARLEDMVREKNILLKEVHHRVKNNLQMIASIMNMQIRTATHDETVENLQKIQDRVTNLASIHRDLYTSPKGGRVDVGELIKRNVEQTIELSPIDRSQLDLRLDIDSVLLLPDQAVPLSLLAAETMTNAVKFMRAPVDGPSVLDVSLKSTGNTCAFKISNTTESIPDEIGGGVGGKLIRAFATKLGAELETHNQDGLFTLSLTFTVAEFEIETQDY